jgi:hypothetical protein
LRRRKKAGNAHKLNGTPFQESNRVFVSIRVDELMSAPIVREGI